MSNFILSVLARARNAFRSLGIQPPNWLIQLGRRLHEIFSRTSHHSALFATRNRQHASQLEAKLDHIIWSIERIEATLYLQSLQASIQAVPQQVKQPVAGPVVMDASQDP